MEARFQGSLSVYKRKKNPRRCSAKKQVEAPELAAACGVALQWANRPQMTHSLPIDPAVNDAPMA